MTVIFVILTLNNEQKINISALLSIRPVYSRPLTDGLLSVCVFLCTLRVQFFRNFTLSKYFDHVALLAFPMYTFFVLHSFSVAFSSRCTLSMFTFPVLHSFLFFAIYFTFCVSFVLHFFQVSLFPCCSFFKLHSFHIALFSYRILLVLHSYQAALFLCSTIFMLHFLRIVLFLCCTAIHEFFFRTDFLQKSLERLPLFHVLHKVF